LVTRTSIDASFANVDIKTRLCDALSRRSAAASRVGLTT
jgi:hypothetical protein